MNALLLVALALLPATGFAAWFWGRTGRNPSGLAAAGVVAASVFGGLPAIYVLLGGELMPWRFPWPVPGGEFHLETDALTAWFLVPLFLLSACAAVYGAGFWRNGIATRRLGNAWLFYCLLVFAMMLVLLARNALLFLFAWELMALSSFFLVVFEQERATVRRAGWIYLGLSQAGAAFLFALLLILGHEANSMDFTHWAWRGVDSPVLAGVLFALAVLGFGAKAGFVPLHIWLPEAHPAAPSHVSALMSGVLIKTGIYGLIRTLTFLGEPAAWWGGTLLGIGLLTAIFGVTFALAQHDLKRLLAYSSVENIGLMAAGLGLGLLGWCLGEPVVGVLGLAAALLHAFNHTLFKGLLFLGAGSVLHATGSRQFEDLGGLLKPLPWTGALFGLGAVALCGLPPLNGFLSELLLMLTAFGSVLSPENPLAVAGLLTVAVLALVSGLAVATFSKAFGATFLGEPRKPTTTPQENTGTMRAAMCILAAACVAVGFFGFMLVTPLQRVVAVLSPQFPKLFPASPSPLVWVSGAGVALLVLVAGLAVWRKTLLARRTVDATVTWDCGYARPHPRMQYTASSFAQPLTALFRALLRNRVRLSPPTGILPTAARLATEAPDLCAERLARPLFARLTTRLARWRWLQHGNVQLYVLYIALTLLALLLWKLR